jgi:hypothetical protein
MSAKDKPVSKAVNDKFRDNFDHVFGKCRTLKDRVKQGVSPSTVVEDWDCRRIKVDAEYFYTIQRASEFLELLEAEGVEDWPGYAIAEEQQEAAS